MNRHAANWAQKHASQLVLAFLGATTILGASAAHAADHQVEIRDNAFHPAELRIQAGDRVIWLNHEKRTSHSVVLDSGEAESERFFPDDQWAHDFDTPGVYPYHCEPHPDMTGQVIVEAAPKAD